MAEQDRLEIEVKFFLEHPEPVRDRIVGMGAHPLGKCFETNIRFDDEAGRFGKKNALLRLRKDRKATLTYKSPQAEHDPEFKVLKEIEVEVSDFRSMHMLLESIGFRPEQIYEKWRESFLLAETKLCIDKMPFGTFLEIEGERSEIRKLADEIGFPWGQRILWNYLAIFETLRSRWGLPFYDVTFKNFEGGDEFKKYLHLFTAG
jgi:adenylate cyclase class 2